MIYFIQAGGPLGAVKIGLTTAKTKGELMNGRFKALQSSHPEELELVRYMQGDRHLEAALHSEFAANRIRGEWFKFDAKMLSISEEEVFATRRLLIILPESLEKNSIAVRKKRGVTLMQRR